MRVRTWAGEADGAEDGRGTVSLLSLESWREVEFCDRQGLIFFGVTTTAAECERGGQRRAAAALTWPCRHAGAPGAVEGDLEAGLHCWLKRRNMQRTGGCCMRGFCSAAVSV